MYNHSIMSTPNQAAEPDGKPRRFAGLGRVPGLMVPLAMVILGAALGLMNTDEAYIDAVAGGMYFAATPILLAVVLLMAYRALRWLIGRVSGGS